MSTSKSEAFSRVLIDKALEYSGWNLLDEKQVVFELRISEGRADYLLASCVVERLGCRIREAAP
jgi:predicted type IV restriction endonuclease